MNTILFILLYPFTIIYGSILHFRNKLYDWNVFSSNNFENPIISVGNLALGGTGKTPHTEYLIRLLQKKYNIATLSRGYKRKTKGFYLANNNSTVPDIGDEPLQYKLKFPQLNVAVDEKRVRGVEQIKKHCPNIDIIILDDAYQHRAITPGLNILITEYNNLYSDDTVIPSGRLREWNIGSKRANIIVVSKSKPDLSPSDRNQIQVKLQPKAYQKIFFSSIKYGAPLPFTTAAKQRSDINLNNCSLLLITGIAKPTPLVNHLKEKNSSLEHIQFPDHHNYKSSDITKIKTHYKSLQGNNKFIISTEKDIMRLSLPEILNEIDSVPIFYIPIEIYFHGNDKVEFDKQIIEYVTKNKWN